MPCSSVEEVTNGMPSTAAVWRCALKDGGMNRLINNLNNIYLSYNKKKKTIRVVGKYIRIFRNPNKTLYKKHANVIILYSVIACKMCNY